MRLWRISKCVSERCWSLNCSCSWGLVRMACLQPHPSNTNKCSPAANSSKAGEPTLLAYVIEACGQRRRRRRRWRMQRRGRSNGPAKPGMDIRDRAPLSVACLLLSTDEASKANAQQQSKMGQTQVRATARDPTIFALAVRLCSGFATSLCKLSKVDIAVACDWLPRSTRTRRLSLQFGPILGCNRLGRELLCAGDNQIVSHRRI